MAETRVVPGVPEPISVFDQYQKSREWWHQACFRYVEATNERDNARRAFDEAAKRLAQTIQEDAQDPSEGSGLSAKLQPTPPPQIHHRY